LRRSFLRFEIGKLELIGHKVRASRLIEVQLEYGILDLAVHIIRLEFLRLIVAVITINGAELPGLCIPEVSNCKVELAANFGLLNLVKLLLFT
jgi:hypothetical protein